MLTCLAHRNFALLWAGQSLSAIGNRMLPVILAVVVIERGWGATGLGLVLAAQSVALAVGTLAAASVADRWRRRDVMFAADLVRAAGVAVIAIAPGRLPYAALLGLVLGIGIAEGLFGPAYSAVLPRVLPGDRLQEGNSLITFGTYSALVAGPSLAGLVIATAGSSAALWVDVGTFAIGLVTLVLMHEAAPPQAEASKDERRALRDLAEGIRAIWVRPWLAASTVMSMLIMTFAMAPLLIGAPIEAEHRLGGSKVYGLLMTAIGVGSIAGTFLGSRIRTRRPGVAAVCGVLTVAVALLSLGFLPLPGILVCWAVTGVGITVFEILWVTAVHRDVPDRLLGRVMALDSLVTESLTPLGYLATGALIAQVGVHPLVVGGAVFVLVIAPLVLLVKDGPGFATAKVAEKPVTAPVASSHVRQA
jgi:predicted MFS family arabinose efflux permease